MGIREIIERAHKAQIKAGKSIPLQRPLFTGGMTPWEADKCECTRHRLCAFCLGLLEGDKK
jgi:hypothetical protein